MRCAINKARDSLIIALDDLDRKQAIALTKKLKAYAATFKVANSLYCAYGPEIVEEIKSLGVEVFLDLKLHDIPMQVQKSVENAIKLAPRFLTVHALGGSLMLKSAQAAVKNSNTLLLAVSVLTSLNSQAWQELGFSNHIEAGVVRLLGLAQKNGINGFVASPKELIALKKEFPNSFIVTPGVRFSDDEQGDQQRINTPLQAILDGADALVVGRPITKALDPVKKAQEFNLAINKALAKKEYKNYETTI